MRRFAANSTSGGSVPTLTELSSASKRPAAVTQRSLLFILLAWLSTVVLHEIDIGGEWDPVAFRTWALIAAWLTCFTATYWMVLARFRTKLSASPVTRSPAWVNAWVAALSVVAAMGAMLIIFDFAILRGYGFNMAVAAIRAEEATNLMRGNMESSAVSGAGRLMIPAILPAYLLSVCRWADLNATVRAVLAAGSLVLITEQLQFEGGRTFLAAAALTCILCYFIYPSGPDGRTHSGIVKKKIPVIRIAVLAVIMMSFFTYVFVDRVLQRDAFFWTAYLQTATNYPMDVNFQGAEWFEGPLGPLWYSICMFWLYITQGLSQLDFLLSLQYFEHAHGFYQVPHLAKIAWIIFGIDLRYDIVANLPTIGTYATFYGHNFVDFGNFGAVVSGAVLGGLTAGSMYGFSSGRLDSLSIQAPILLIICLFSPIISLVPNLWPAMAWAVVVAASGRNR